MDGERKKAILTWLNCLQIGSEITELSQLIDGSHFIQILKIIWTSNKKREFLTLDDWITSLHLFLDDFYRTPVTDVIDFEQIAKGDELEIAKATVLLLSATVHFENDRRFVDLPTCLDSKIQHQIKQIIEGVLVDGEQPLNHNFAEILVSTDMFDCLIYETTSPRKSSGDDLNRSFGESGESKTISPIQQLLQSPLILNKLKLRDKDRHIHRLEAELDAERMMRVDNEAELQKQGLLIESKEKALKIAEKDLRTFQMQYEDTKTHLDETTVQLERFKSKSEKCEILMEECKQLRSELDAVIDDKMALQEENEELSKACQSVRERLRESEAVERKLCEVQALLEDRESIIVALKYEQQVLLMEFRQMRQIYKEKTAILEKELEKKPEANGEVMTVVTETCLRELRILHHQLKDQYDTFKLSSESEITKLVTEKTSLEAIIEEKGRKIILLQEKRARLLEELNKQNVQVSELAVKISKLEEDVEEMLANKLRLEEEIESKDNTATELKTQLELKALEFRNFEEKLLGDLNTTKCELALYVEKCETLESEIGRLDTTLHELQIEMADKKLKWESQVKLMTTEKETLEKEMDARNEDMKRLVVELVAKEELVSKLKEQIEVENYAYELMVFEHEATVDLLQEQLSELEKELSDKIFEFQTLENVRREEKSLHELQLMKYTDDISKLNEVVSQKDGTIVSLDRQISEERASSEQMIVEQNTQFQILLKEVEQIGSRLTEKEEKLQLTETHLKEHKDDITKLHEFVSEKDGTIESLNQQISCQKSSSEQTIAECIAEIKKLQSEVEQIGCELKDKEDKLQMAESKLRKYTDDITELHEVVLLKDNKIESLDQQISDEKSLSEQIIAENNSEIKRLRTEVDEINYRLKEKVEKLELTEVELKERTKNVTKLEEVVTEKSGIIENLNDQIDREKASSQQVIAEQDFEIQRLRTEVEEISCDFKEKLEKLQMAEVQLKEYTNDITKLEDAVLEKNCIIDHLNEQMCHETSSSERVIVELKSDIGKLRSEVENISCRLTEKEEKLQKAEKEMETERALVNAELCVREQDLKSLKLETVELQRHLGELQEKMTLEQDILLETVEKEKSAAKKLFDQLDCLERTVQEKDELLDTMSKKSEHDRLSMEATMQVKDDEIKRLEADVVQKNESVSEIEKLLAEERENLEEMKRNAKLSIEKLEKEMFETVRELEKLRSEATDKDEVVKTIEKAVTSLEESLKKSECEKLSLESQRKDMNEKVLELENEIHEKDDVRVKMCQESNELKETVNKTQCTVDGLLKQIADLRDQVKEKEEIEVMCNKEKTSLETELESFKLGVRHLKDELDDKSKEMAEERDKLSRRLQSLQQIIDGQRDIIMRLERSDSKDSSTKQTAEMIEMEFLKVTNLHDVEKVRRRSIDVESRLNFSDLRDISLCRSMTVNGTFMDSRRFDFDVREEVEDVTNNQLDYSEELGIEDSLEEIRPQSRFTNVSLQPSSGDKCDHRRNSSSEMALLMNMQLHCENLQKENKALFGDNHSLQSKVQELQNKLEEQKAAVKLQTDLPHIIQRLKEQVFESESKNAVALRMVKIEYDSMKKQCEATKKTAQDLKNVIIEKETLLGEQAKQLEQYKMYCDSKKQQHSNIVAMLKNEKEMSHFLKSKLQEEEKKCAPYVEKIREQEMTLQRQIQEKRSIETQLNLASQKLRDLQKGNTEFGREELQHHTRPSSRASHSMLARQTSTSLNTLAKYTASMRETVSDGQLAFEDLATEMSESVNDCDSKVWASANVSTASAYRAVPAGAGNYFKCEDEEGEFLNFSYLDDLKRGKCEVEDQHGRISELQRRNTLCLPHLKTSYPVEMQMQSTQKFTDNDLKAGAAVEDSLFPSKNEATETTMGTRKSKHIQPSYQKPGPPTPGKSGRQGSSVVTEKPVKTPSSIKKLIQRSVFGTPKRANRENVPPEKTKVSRARKNIAFQVGFSPKVKSVSKQQPLNNRVEQRRQPPN